MKPAALRPQAKRDLADQAEYYARQGGVRLGDEFLAAALAALAQVQAEPGMASPRLGRLLGLPGLRAWRLDRFPLQWIFIDTGERLDVVRLLADRQDIDALLRAAARPARRPRRSR